jgi:hypothetical protein
MFISVIRLKLTSVFERMGTSDDITVITMGDISFLTCIIIRGCQCIVPFRNFVRMCNQNRPQFSSHIKDKLKVADGSSHYVK